MRNAAKTTAELDGRSSKLTVVTDASGSESSVSALMHSLARAVSS